MKMPSINQFIYIGLALIFIVSFIGSVSESLQLSLISRDEKGLTPVGRLKLSEGYVRRKLVNDVLWFPVSPNDKIFLGDGIETGNESWGQIELSGGVKGSLKINANTTVRMRFYMRKPMIVLNRGEVDLSGEISESIYVSSGLRAERVQIRKGSQIKVKRTDDGDLEVKVFRTDVKNDQGMAEIGQSKDIWVNANSEKSGLDSTELGMRPLKYPYPADQTAFLAMQAGKIRVLPKEKCEVTCRFHINDLEGKNVLSIVFQAGEAIVGDLPYNKTTVGDYRWTLEDSGQPSSGVFYVRPFSSAEMKKQMQMKRPIEVLTGL